MSDNPWTSSASIKAWLLCGPLPDIMGKEYFDKYYLGAFTPSEPEIVKTEEGDTQRRYVR